MDVSPGFSRRSEGPRQGRRVRQRTGDAEEQEAEGQGLGRKRAGPRGRPGNGRRATGKTRLQQPTDYCVNILVVNYPTVLFLLVTIREKVQNTFRVLVKKTNKIT